MMLPAPSYRATLAGVVFGSLLAGIGLGGTGVAIPAMMRAFQADANLIQWVVNGHYLAVGMCLPLAPWLIDRMGHKQGYLAALGVFLGGTMLAAFSASFPLLLLARIIQGVGGGLIVPITIGIIYRDIPRERAGRAMGIWSIGMLSASIFGSTVGGYMVQRFGWASIFLAWMPVAGLALALAVSLLRVAPPARAMSSGFDFGGWCSLALGASSLQIAMSNGAKLGWSSSLVLALLITAAVSLTVFIWWELRHPAPLLDLRLFQNRHMKIGAVCLVVYIGAENAAYFFIPIVLQTVLGFSPATSALLMIPSNVVSSLFQPVAGRIFDSKGPKFLIFGGLATLALSKVLYSMVPLHAGAALIIGLHIIMGIGTGMAYMPCVTTGLMSLPTASVPAASGMLTVMQRLSAGLGIAMMSGLYTGWVAEYRITAPSPQHAAMQGAGNAFLVTATLLALGSLIPLAFKLHKDSMSSGQTVEEQRAVEG